MLGLETDKLGLGYELAVVTRSRDQGQGDEWPIAALQGVR